MRILNQNPHMIDPSELLRPELLFADKEISKFRDYTIDTADPLKERVRNTYKLMHENQTVQFVKGNKHKFTEKLRNPH
jgi:inositol oxygenase